MVRSKAWFLQLKDFGIGLSLGEVISLGIELSLRSRVCFKDEGIGIEFGGRSNLGVGLS